MARFLFESKHVNYIGKGKGDLLIILPGNTASSIAYQPQIDFLSQHFFTVSIDYLGAGNSERISDIKENWWNFSAKQVNALINHLGYKKAIIVGTSGGAIVGMHLAADFPEKVSKLVLDSFSVRFTENMLENNVIRERSNPNEMQKDFWKYCHGEDWENIVNYDTENIKNMVVHGGDWLANSPEKVMCPVLLTGSKKDEFIPEIEREYKQLSTKIQNCKIALSEQGNHPLMWTKTEFFIFELMAFVAT